MLVKPNYQKMKNIMVMRHAKSDWSKSSLSDFDRPLNARGLKSAPFMGAELLKRNRIPDLIISSPATRAKTTAILAAESLGYQKEIVYEQDFYFGSIVDIIEKIKLHGEENNCVMVVGHNPTWESLVYKLIKTKSAVQLPTAAVASVQFDIEDWKDLNPGSGELEFLLIPKDLMLKV